MKKTYCDKCKKESDGNYELGIYSNFSHKFTKIVDICLACRIEMKEGKENE